MRYDIDEARAVTFATGLHSKAEALSIYNMKVTGENDQVSLANKDLKMTKAVHVCWGV